MPSSLPTTKEHSQQERAGTSHSTVLQECTERVNLDSRLSVAKLSVAEAPTVNTWKMENPHNMIVTRLSDKAKPENYTTTHGKELALRQTIKWNRLVLPGE
ncbi:hypothetical protein EUGRSUZ_I00148 [Eucalyptus grandis]|uniref:Uncharacterized protein n=2 Tax=Eucalyptus grandis TaxID=71139 RepID=A0ACC3JBE3_EUCGR|nr:hypothetical protein EUGRSUZ_I00148 [Eucalyptus grandis]